MVSGGQWGGLWSACMIAGVNGWSMECMHGLWWSMVCIQGLLHLSASGMPCKTGSVIVRVAGCRQTRYRHALSSSRAGAISYVVDGI